MKTFEKPIITIIEIDCDVIKCSTEGYDPNGIIPDPNADPWP